MKNWCMAVLMVWGTVDVRAIVIRHDRDDEDYQALGKKFPATCFFHLGGRMGAGTGTLIAPRWVLTAAHVAEHIEPGDLLTADGLAYQVGRTVLHPEWNATFFGNDIALVQLKTAVAGVDPIPIYRGRTELAQVMTMVGRGRSGNGEKGLGAWDRVLRGAHNRVEAVKRTWLVFRFDHPEKGENLEGISGPGDSGGPAYLQTDKGVFIAGVSSWQDNRAQNGVEGVYGVWEHYARVSHYATWIDSVLTP